MWRMGRGTEPPLGSWTSRTVAFLRYAISDLFFHRRFFQDIYPALIHLLIFWSFFLLFLGTVSSALDHYVFHFLKGEVYLTASLILDIAGILLLAGVAMAAFRRYVQRPARLDNKPADAFALIWLALMSISGLMVEGARLATPEPGSDGAGGIWMPAGTLASRWFLTMNRESIEMWHRWLWWSHAVLGMVALLYTSIYFNRLIHILISPLNVFLFSKGYRGALRPINLESDQPIGVGEVHDLSWKNMLELDACTRCGRCQENCPAYLSEKILNPKKIIQDLKENWLNIAKSPGKHTEEEKALIPAVIQQQAIWDCTSCFACHQQCPVLVQPMNKVMEMRRYQAMMLGKLPPSAQAAIQNMQKRGHPWTGNQFMRLRDDWTKEVSVHKINPGEKIHTLLFVGCTGALVDRNVSVTRAVVRLLNKAGIEFGVLGSAEFCCGDPARRLGYESLYQSMAQANIQCFRESGVERIITTCSHCYNTLKNEYPEMGGRFSVYHHSEILADLLGKGLLKAVTQRKELKYTYHDPCYLGRYNNIFAAPRRALELTTGDKPEEMSFSKLKGFCCGGGGAHAWLEESGGRRINELRLDQAIATGSSTIATACPYCLQMLENAIEKKSDPSRGGKIGVMKNLKVMDLAEIVEQAMTRE